MNEPTAMELLIQRIVSEPIAVTEKKRKVIQITVAPAALSGSDILYALANDGTMRCTAPQVAAGNWRRIKDIPQENF